MYSHTDSHHEVNGVAVFPSNSFGSFSFNLATLACPACNAVWVAVTVAVTISLSSAGESRTLRIGACGDCGGGVYPPEDGGSGGKEGDREALPGRRVIGGGGGGGAPPVPTPPWVRGPGVGDLGAAPGRLLIDGGATAVGAGAADCR